MQVLLCVKYFKTVTMENEKKTKKKKKAEDDGKKKKKKDDKDKPKKKKKDKKEVKKKGGKTKKGAPLVPLPEVDFVEVGNGISSTADNVWGGFVYGATSVQQRFSRSSDILYFLIAYPGDPVLDRVMVNDADRAMNIMEAHPIFNGCSHLFAELFALLDRFEANRNAASIFFKRLCLFVNVIGNRDCSIITKISEPKYPGPVLEPIHAVRLETVLSKTIRYFKRFTRPDAFAHLLVGDDSFFRFPQYDMAIANALSSLVLFVRAEDIEITPNPRYQVVCDIKELALSAASDPDAISEIQVKFGISNENRGQAVVV